jgi:hypothetical protein
LGGGSHSGFADEDRAGFNGKDLGLDVTDDFRAGFEFDAVGGGEIAMDLAVNDHRGGFDFRFDTGVLTDDEVALGENFTVDFSVHHEVIGELDDAFDFHIRGQHIARGDRGGAGSCSRCRVSWVGCVAWGWWDRKGFRVIDFRTGWSGAGCFAMALTNDFLEHGGGCAWMLDRR